MTGKKKTERKGNLQGNSPCASFVMIVRSCLILASSHPYENSNYFHTGQHINWPHDLVSSYTKVTHPRADENEILKANLGGHQLERMSQGQHIDCYFLLHFVSVSSLGEAPDYKASILTDGEFQQLYEH